MTPGIRRSMAAWGAATIVAVYWGLQLLLALTDFPALEAFFSRLRGMGAFLAPFLVLWIANRDCSWRVRLLGLGALGMGAGLGALFVHPSIERAAYLICAVPLSLTAGTLWMLASSFRRSPLPASLLGAALLLPFAVLDLFRRDGLDGSHHASYSLRWTATAEQDFLEQGSRPTSEGPTRSWTLKPGDWPEFRGADRDGVVRGTKVAQDWNSEAPRLVWRRRVGPGWSGMIVVDGFLVTQEQRGAFEAVVCYRADSGATAWVWETPARFSEDASGTGPRATPTFRDGRIYALGASGILSCLDPTTGKPIWTLDVAKEAAAPLPRCGFASSPLVVDRRVIVFAGGEESRSVLAVDAATGARAWARDGGKESYASAQLVSLAGTPQILINDSRGLAGLAVADGRLLWQHPSPDATAIPILQPRLLSERSLIVATGSGLTRLDVSEATGGAWALLEKWSTPRLRSSFNDFVLHSGHLYGVEDGALTCIDPRTGLRVWKKGRYGSGQALLLADQGLLLVLTENGDVAMATAEPQEPADVARFPAIRGKTWNHPTLVADRLYVRNGAEMACFSLPTIKPGSLRK